jgi:hypothetical protein
LTTEPRGAPQGAAASSVSTGNRAQARPLLLGESSEVSTIALRAMSELTLPTLDLGALARGTPAKALAIGSASVRSSRRSSSLHVRLAKRPGADFAATGRAARILLGGVP